MDKPVSEEDGNADCTLAFLFILGAGSGVKSWLHSSLVLIPSRMLLLLVRLVFIFGSARIWHGPGVVFIAHHSPQTLYIMAKLATNLMLKMACTSVGLQL